MFRKTFIVLLFVFAMPSASMASHMIPVNFPQQSEQGGVKVTLKRIGLKRAFMMRAFAAAFYLQDGVSVQKAAEDVAKKVDVYHFVNIPGNKLYSYTKSIMKKNTTAEEFEALGTKVEELKKYFPDLKVKDRFAIFYVPGVGTNFLFNDKVIGTIEGYDFANALFSVWIGKRPMDPYLRKQILGILSNPISYQIDG